MDTKNKKIIIIGVVTIIILGVLVLLSQRKSVPFIPNTNPPLSPTLINEGTGQSQEFREDAARSFKQSEVFLNQEARIGGLVKVVPVQGTYMKFDYDFKRVTFVLTLNKDKELDGLNEFNAFLQKNGIKGREWIRNLEIVYQ